ncbi:MAG TPA: RnfABCDGE type electron transport complex subunit D [Candidatus Dormibacteraeota bacterium]
MPSIVAGIIFFRLDALETLGVAVGAGLAAHVASRLLNQPLQGTPLLPALVGVALVGSGARLPWAAAVAVLAAAFELGRARFLPVARLQVGLLAYAAVLLLSRGDLATYLSPAGIAAPEPIRFWLQQSGGGQVSIDPVRQYVGNVAGPILATSMLAVALGTAWLWYAGRLSLLVVLTFLAGAMVAITMRHWSPAYHLDSGPLWFVAALVLADRHTLPASAVGRPLLGLVAGWVALGARARGFAIESAFVTVAGMQLLTVALQGLSWVRGHREETWTRLRELREAMPAVGRLHRPGPAQPRS